MNNLLTKNLRFLKLKLIFYYTRISKIKLNKDKNESQAHKGRNEMLALSLNKFRQNMRKILSNIKSNHEPVYLRERGGGI